MPALEQVTGPPWGALAERPWFVLTADQDWAPEWCNEYLLEYADAHRIPLHVFRTSPSPALDAAVRDGLITQGWHPNFGPGSSHGATDEEIIGYFTTHFPGCVSVRSHGFQESYLRWLALVDAGVRYDSQQPTAFVGHLTPTVHASGIRSIPVYLEDDVWLDTFPDTFDLARVKATFGTSGLKVVNLHPVHLGVNSPSRRYYDERRPRLYGPDFAEPDELSYRGRGIRQLIDALVADAAGLGQRFVPFPELCRQIDATIARAPELAGDWSARLR